MKVVVKLHVNVNEIMLWNCNAEMLVLLIVSWFKSVNTQKPL
jgi:hypothetical protein